MSVWKLLVVTYVTFVAQTSLVSTFEIAGVRPNFIILGLLLLIPNLSAHLIVPVAAAWGLLSDALVPSCPGIDLVCYSTAAFALWHFQRRGISQTTIGRILLLFPAAFLLLLGSGGLREIASGSLPRFTPLIEESAMTAVLTAAIGSLMVLASAFRRRSDASVSSPNVHNRWKFLTQ